MLHLKLPLYKALCVAVSYRFACLLVKTLNQVYPLISALFSQHISQVKITTASKLNQMPGNFDIHVNNIHIDLHKKLCPG